MTTRTFQGKPKPEGKSGHFYEPMRHSLQAKGFKTGTKNVHPLDYGAKHKIPKPASEFPIVTGADGRKYKVSNETYYSNDTSDEMVKILDRLRENQQRVRFHWGNTKTGEDWGDDLDVEGTIGRSTGSIKIPLLINNARSMGGIGLLTGSIVRIRHANKKDGGDIYRHPKYHQKGGKVEPAPKPAVKQTHPENPVNSSNLVNYIMEYEGGDISKKDYLNLMAYLIKTGQAWSLQGSIYGRPAHDLIENGLISRDGKVNWDVADNTED